VERLLVIPRQGVPEKLMEFARTTRDGDLIDLDVFNHESTFVLEAFGKGGTQGFAPVAQPLMIEHLIFRPGLTRAQTGQAIVRLAEHVIEEAYRRDVGDVYFLGHDESTCEFAELYGFKEVSKLAEPLRCYRMNLLETYGG
jgi:hypothetical protein